MRSLSHQCSIPNFSPRVQKELYMFDNPLYMQVHSKYDNFINVAETFVGVRSRATLTTPSPHSLPCTGMHRD